MLVPISFSFDLNQIANIHGKHLSSLILLFWIGLVPVVFVYVIFPLLRGRRRLIWIFIILLFALIFVAPIILVINSAICLEQISGAYLLFIMIALFNLLAIGLLEERVKRFLYKDDSIYDEENLVPDGSKKNFYYKKNRLTLFIACWIISSLSFMVFGLFLFITLINMGYWTLFSVGMIGIGLFMFITYFIGLRWLMRCEICNHPIFELKGDGKEGHKSWFIQVSWRVICRKPFECVWCGAHYYLKK